MLSQPLVNVIVHNKTSCGLWNDGMLEYWNSE
jgi:hypothetical protein